MTITQDLIDSLRDGDLVRAKHVNWKYPIEGKVSVDGNGETRQVGGFIFTDYMLRTLGELWDIEVLERAPRFYVNCDREPVPGDVCRLDKDGGTNARTTWSFRPDQQWYVTRTGYPVVGDFGRNQPVLIVDGDTGLPVMPESVQAELRHLRAVAEL